MTMFAGPQVIADTQGEVDRDTDYQARKNASVETGECMRRGCTSPHADDSLLCPQHRDEQREARRTSAQRVRGELAAAGKCVDCRRRSPTYRCAACSVKRGRIPSMGVDHGVENKTPAHWRVEPGTTWNRYRGKAKRGKPSTAVLDDQDLDYAVEQIQTAKQALAYARSEAVQAMPKVQRDGVMAAALGFVDAAERWLDEVRARHKSRKP